MVFLWIESTNRRQYASLRFSVKPTHWNGKSGRVRKSHHHHEALNRIIDQHVSRAQEAYYSLLAAGEAISPEAIKKKMLPARAAKADLIAFGKEYADELRKLGKIPTGNRYASIMRNLKDFAGQPFPFSHLTVQFLRDYRGHMASVRKNSASTIASNFRAIKSLTNRAIRDGILPQDANPFRDFPITEPRSAKRKLSTDEIAAIPASQIKPKTDVWHARNYFLFSFYCAGVRFRDVCLLKVENVEGGRLSYVMNKTGMPKSIQLVPAAIDILALYVSELSDLLDRVFPLIRGYDTSIPFKLDRAVQSKNALVNRHLKELATIAGVNGNISFHMSRHSWADFARREGWDVYKISKALAVYRTFGSRVS